MLVSVLVCLGFSSLSARRAWIEILMKCQVKKYSGVALRKESVDRNRHYRDDVPDQCVALRKESVDRNRWGDYSTGAATVALRKESVDRNVGA